MILNLVVGSTARTEGANAIEYAAPQARNVRPYLIARTLRGFWVIPPRKRPARDIRRVRRKEKLLPWQSAMICYALHVLSSRPALARRAFFHGSSRPNCSGALQQHRLNHFGVEQQSLTSFQVRYTAGFGFAAQPLLRHAESGSRCAKRDQLRSSFHGRIVAERSTEVYSAYAARIQRGYFAGRLLAGMK